MRWCGTCWSYTTSRVVSRLISFGSFVNVSQFHSAPETRQTLLLLHAHSAWKLVPLCGARRTLSHSEKKNRPTRGAQTGFINLRSKRAIKITGGQLIILLRNHNVNLTVNTEHENSGSPHFEININIYSSAWRDLRIQFHKNNLSHHITLIELY